MNPNNNPSLIEVVQFLTKRVDICEDYAREYASNNFNALFRWILHCGSKEKMLEVMVNNPTSSNNSSNTIDNGSTLDDVDEDEKDEVLDLDIGLNLDLDF